MPRIIIQQYSQYILFFSEFLSLYNNRNIKLSIHIIISNSDLIHSKPQIQNNTITFSIHNK